MSVRKMKLEHRKQDIVPLSHFLLRFFGYGLFAATLIVFSVGIGTVGYYYFAEMNWLDSFYMSCMILTGMGPTAEMKTGSAKLFSSFYALYSGIAFLSITAVILAPVIHRVMHILHLESGKKDD
ncbi:MAG: hypothetical protein V4615_10215 [Bacteroidota bacterium]